MPRGRRGRGGREVGRLRFDSRGRVFDDVDWDGIRMHRLVCIAWYGMYTAAQSKACDCELPSGSMYCGGRHRGSIGHDIGCLAAEEWRL